MALWRLYYHLVWATKERQPLITREREGKLYGYIISKADELGTIIHAIDGIENHIHLVASIPPKISISDFVQKIKGSTRISHKELKKRGQNLRKCICRKHFSSYKV
jgi:REP element-mobilizing transposase RayT